jgi:hypothetical protein
MSLINAKYTRHPLPGSHKLSKYFQQLGYRVIENVCSVGVNVVIYDKTAYTLYAQITHEQRRLL